MHKPRTSTFFFFLWLSRSFYQKSSSTLNLTNLLVFPVIISWWTVISCGAFLHGTKMKILYTLWDLSTLLFLIIHLRHSRKPMSSNFFWHYLQDKPAWKKNKKVKGVISKPFFNFYQVFLKKEIPRNTKNFPSYDRIKVDVLVFYIAMYCKVHIF